MAIVFGIMKVYFMFMIGLKCDVREEQATYTLNLPIGVFAVVVVVGTVDEAVIDVDAVDSVDDVADAVDDATVDVDDVGIAVDEAVVDMDPPDVVIIEVFVAVEDVVTVPVEDTELEEEVASKEKLDFF